MKNLVHSPLDYMYEIVNLLQMVMQIVTKER